MLYTGGAFSEILFDCGEGIASAIVPEDTVADMSFQMLSESAGQYFIVKVPSAMGYCYMPLARRECVERASRIETKVREPLSVGCRALLVHA